MPTLNLGRVRFNWRGAYQATTQYLKHDMVTFDGESYACIQDVKGTSPKDSGGATYWDIALARGADYNNARDQAIQAATDAETARAAAVVQKEDAETAASAAESHKQNAATSASAAADSAAEAAGHAAAVDADNLSTDHYGTEAPAITRPGMKWADAANGWLMRRDPTDTFWIPERPLFQTGSPVSGFKNKIINGNFDVWQRYTSRPENGYWTDDRWYNYHIGSTKNHSRETFTPGQTVIPGHPIYFSRTVVTSVAGNGYGVAKLQRIEDVRTLSGGPAVLQFWAKADGNKKLGLAFHQNFGTGGSPLVTFGVQSVNLTSSWQRFVVKIEVPSILGKSMGVNNFFGLTFLFDAASGFIAGVDSVLVGRQSGIFDIARVQLAAGIYETDFEERPLTIETQLCQRYYYTSHQPDTPWGTSPVWWSVQGLCAYPSTTVPLPVTMRSAPSVSIISSIGSEGNITRDGVQVPGSVGVSNPNFVALRVNNYECSRDQFLACHITCNAEL